MIKIFIIDIVNVCVSLFTDFAERETEYRLSLAIRKSFSGIMMRLACITLFISYTRGLFAGTERRVPLKLLFPVKLFHIKNPLKLYHTRKQARNPLLL